MKTLTAAALTEIAKQFGTEPLSIVEIEWEPGSVSQYADREVEGIQGKILSISAITSVITIENVRATDVNISLDDTDGTIKAILDEVDIHKKSATIYQYYGDLTLTDKFTVFKGKISTPFTWGEDDRQINFSIVSEIESFEVGFSPEEGQLDFVSEDLIGNPWPLVFGSYVYAPATKVWQIPQAHTLDLLVRHDPLLEWKIIQIVNAYQLELFIFTFWGLVVRGASLLAPPVSEVLTEYVKAIIREDLLFIEIVKKERELDSKKWECQKHPGDRFLRDDLVKLEEDLNNLAKLSHIIIIQKEYLEYLVKLCKFEYEMKKKALLEQINSNNRLRTLFADFIDAWKELCEQLRYERTTIRVQEAEYAGFPDGEPTDVIIKNVQARVQFDHSNKTMTILVLPVGRYQNIPVQWPWTPDDEPCTSPATYDGMDMFRIQQVDHPSLEGLYLLVKKYGTQDTETTKVRHIIKVRKHKGQKIYFNLIKWATQWTGQPPGVDMDDYIRKIVDTPYIRGPFGNAIPSTFFTGQFDPALWARPESQLLLAILSTIPGGVNKDEYKNLATLVFLLPKDQLSDQLILIAPTPDDVYTIIGPEVVEVIEASALPLASWFYNYVIPFEEVPSNLLFEAPPGTTIRPAGPDCEIYIANILPSTIKAVHAYRENEDGERYLAPIPSRYYIKNESADLGTYQVTALTFPRALRNIPSENWEDDVYVTLVSSVGPNVVDIMEWIIDTYTDKTVDATNFATAKTLIQSGGEELYPANICLLSRPNALEELNRIAWESRFALYLQNDVFFLKYLSAEPTQDDSLTRADVETETLKIEYSATEDLVTRMIATYNKTGLPLEPGEKQSKYVLRHNIKKYGLHSSTEHFHIYNIPELVLKSATFWMIRRSNTWKKIRFQTFHTKIRLDTLDTLLLSFSETFFANSPIKGIIEQAEYNSAENSIMMLVHTGIKTGEMDQYIHFWPALQDPPEEFPTNLEIELGFAGGYGPGQGVTGTIDDCPEED